MSNPPPNRPPGPGPGRLAPGASRARHGGSAAPLPPEESAGRGPSRRPPRITPRGNEQGSPPSYSPHGTPDRLPPSIPPGGGAPGGQVPPDRTRVMPAGHPAHQHPAHPGHAPPSSPSTAPPDQGAPRAPRPRRRRRRRPVLIAFLVLLVLILAWPVGLLIWANSKINHVDVGQSGLTTEIGRAHV